MCGICGKVNFRRDFGDETLIRRMCETLRHRGPDDEGIHVGPGVALGQRRLSIIDLRTSATAPLSNEDQTIWVVFNGEIYNYRELRVTLASKGHQFKTESDTEVIVHSYEEYGVDCVNHFFGMFAFAIWDSKRKRLFAARDRLGKKPFNYAITGSAFLFGSEIKALHCDSDVSSEIDYGAIRSYLEWGYVRSPKSAFKSISKLPPATYLVLDAESRNLTLTKYWDPFRVSKIAIGLKEAEERLVSLLEDAVRLRMVADVPFGAFLSGGVDSGMIVALMARQSRSQIKTFSIGFEDDAMNELPYARQVAERYATDHHEFVLKAQTSELLPKLVWHYNEPFADSSALPSYYVSHESRRFVTVALCGDGGDENFLGYNQYMKVKAWGRADFIPASLRSAGSRFARRLALPLANNNTVSKICRALSMFGGSLSSRYRLQQSIVKPEEAQLLFTKGFEALSSHDSEESDDSHLQAADQFDWMMKNDLVRYLPDCLMTKMDIASMANGLEVRAPLLDERVTEFALSLPTDLKLKNGERKYLLRRIAKHLLPEPILSKPKTGFSIPVDRWFRQELGSFGREICLSDRSNRRGLFNPAYVRRMFDEHSGQRRNWGSRLWSLLFLELWFREFID